MKSSSTLNGLTKHELFRFIYALNEKGGPDTHEYSSLNTYIDSIPLMLQHEIINQGDLETIKKRLQFLSTDNTIMGHSKLKPFGYAGDYLIIDKIYQNQVSENKKPFAC